MTLADRKLWPGILAPAGRAEASSGLDATSADWVRIVDAAAGHGLGSLLALRLRERDLWRRVPESGQETLRRIEIADAASELRRRSCLTRVLDALQRESIVPVIYKGTALAHRSYPTPATRPMVDIDLWVEPSDMQRAAVAMESVGFTHAHSRDARPDAWQALLEGEVKMRNPALGTVELHWGLFPGLWLNVASRIDRAAVMARLATDQVLGREVRLLAPRDHLIQVAMHAAISNRHHIAGLRGLLDIALIADEIDDWQESIDDYERWRIRRVMAHCLQLAGELFDRPALLDVSRQLQSTKRIQWLLRHVDARRVLDAARTLGRFERWSFLLCAVDGVSDALRLVGRALWPTGAWMQARYGGTGLGPRLTHLGKSVSGELQ